MKPLHDAQAKQAAQEAADAASKAEEVRTALLPKPAGTYTSTYDFGNCTAYVASRKSIPSNWGNANAWLVNAIAAGRQTGPVPHVGDIAQTSAGYYGHVAIVEAILGNMVEVSEMNYEGFNVVDTRWTSVTDFMYIQ